MILIMKHGNVGLNSLDIYDQFYTGCEKILKPIFCGFLFDYRATMLEQTAGYVQQPTVSYQTCNTSDYTSLQFGDQFVPSYILSQNVLVDGKTIVLDSMKRANKYDVIRYEPKLIQAGIY